MGGCGAARRRGGEEKSPRMPLPTPRSDDSDMHESDEEFEVKPKTKKRRLDVKRSATA